MIKVLTVVALVAALCVLATSCSGEGVADAHASSDWTTISGRNVSLRLPASFEGGDPADPSVIPVLREMAESSSRSEERETLLRWLDSLEAQTAFVSNPVLVALAAPDDGGFMATVTVDINPLQNILALTDGDRSMRALIEGYMGDPEYWELESIEEAEASAVVRYEGSGENAPAMFDMIRVSGDWYYNVLYSSREGSWNTWHEIFKASSQTLQQTRDPRDGARGLEPGPA